MSSVDLKTKAVMYAPIGSHMIIAGTQVIVLFEEEKLFGTS